MNLYQKIEQLYQDNSKAETDKTTAINKEILLELKEIKELLSQNHEKTKKVDKSMMEFVKLFRENLKPNTSANIYPEVIYQEKVLGVNHKGLLYDKSTLQLLSTSEAFEVYGYFYKKHLNEINI